METANENKINFSVIIPVQSINNYIIETCEKLKLQENRSFEIIILPDEITKNKETFEKRMGARIIATGKVSPAIKRDLSLKYARGKFLAFTDDDAYPEKNWLTLAEKYLSDDRVAAIGGPQITPPEDSFWQKVSGAMFMSPLSGKALIRYWPGKKVQTIDDWPTVNFIIKKDAFEKIGGFDSEYWPGEDTKLCLDILKKLNKKILYIPQLIVYHHRRSGFGKHLKQIGNYGIHRGFFAKVFPDTSIKFDRFYFVPSLFSAYLILGLIASFFSLAILKLYLSGLAIYAAAIIFSTISLTKKTKSFSISLMTIPYLVSFHFWYGIRFIQGFFFTKELKSKLGK